MSKRRGTTASQALEPPRAIFALFDWIERAIAALMLMAAGAKWLPPFAGTLAPTTDLVVSLALVFAAVAFLKALGPKLPTELRGLAYTALLVAAVFALYPVMADRGLRTAGGSSGAHHSATGASGRSGVGGDRGSSHARVPRPATRGAKRVQASSSSSGLSARRSVASYATTTSSTPSSTTPAGASTGHDSPALRRTDSRPSSPASISPAVEVSSSEASSGTPPAKASPAVEMRSEKPSSADVEMKSR